MRISEWSRTDFDRAKIKWIGYCYRIVDLSAVILALIVVLQKRVLSVRFGFRVRYCDYLDVNTDGVSAHF